MGIICHIHNHILNHKTNLPLKFTILIHNLNCQVSIKFLNPVMLRNNNNQFNNNNNQFNKKNKKNNNKKNHNQIINNRVQQMDNTNIIHIKIILNNLNNLNKHFQYIDLQLFLPNHTIVIPHILTIKMEICNNHKPHPLLNQEELPPLVLL